MVSGTYYGGSVQTHAGMLQKRDEVLRKAKEISFPTMLLEGESVELGTRQRWAQWTVVSIFGRVYLSNYGESRQTSKFVLRPIF